MHADDTEAWAVQARNALAAFEEPLLREVAGRLVRPRNRWPAAELIDRCLTALANPAAIDRRLAEAGVGSRRLLAAIARSRCHRWPVSQLLALGAAVNEGDGPTAVSELCGLGLLLPEPQSGHRLRSFGPLFEPDGLATKILISPPTVVRRALGQAPGVAKPESVPGPLEGREADGLAWPLRLAALWQSAQESPFRRTQQGGFFKKDLDRLRGNATLCGESTPFSETPDVPLLAAALAINQGVLDARENELHAGTLPRAWDAGFAEALAELWEDLLAVDRWDPEKGWLSEPRPNPYPAAYVFALLLLAEMAEGEWADACDVEGRVLERHPHWGGRAAGKKPASASAAGPLVRFLFGPAYELRLVQVADNGGQTLVRLSRIGRWLMHLCDEPPANAGPTKTLLVQPNLEVLVYRQGLTPGLVRALSEFGIWKTIGAACTLHLEPDSVYRGLEAGWSYDRICALLDQHGTRPTPPSVTQSLRTWAQKRERITVYPEAALFEFARPEDMEEAFARGFEGVRITDRLAAVPNESAIDYRLFRLSATRDYSVPPGQCVSVGDDGVSLAVDPARSDLLLETELARFAEARNGHAAHEPGRYEVTPLSLTQARERGLGEAYLEEWFVRRTGSALPPAIRLLWQGRATPALIPRQELVLHVPSPEVADGLLQWPATQPHFSARLGPRALVVRDGAWDILRQQLATLGLAVATKPASS